MRVRAPRDRLCAQRIIHPGRARPITGILPADVRVPARRARQLPGKFSSLYDITSIIVLSSSDAGTIGALPEMPPEVSIWQLFATRSSTARSKASLLTIEPPQYLHGHEKSRGLYSLASCATGGNAAGYFLPLNQAKYPAKARCPPCTDVRGEPLKGNSPAPGRSRVPTHLLHTFAKARRIEQS